MRRRSVGVRIGTKIALAVATTAMSVSAAAGILVHHVTASGQLTSARSALEKQMTSTAHSTPARIARSDLPGPVARALRDTNRVTFLQDGPQPVLWAAAEVSDHEVLVLSRSYAPEARALAHLDRTLLLVGATTSALATVIGLGLGTRMGRRATAAARTAERIADGDLDARVRPVGRDEIARLSASIDIVAEALNARLQAERRVTADIAHELRTPVAGMSVAVGLLPPGPAADLVRRSVRALHELVEDVLEVARMDAQVATLETERWQVGAMARRAVAGLAGVEVRVVTDLAVMTDRRRVERVLKNLATNALRYGALPVVVEVDGRVVRVRDHGPGFAPDLLAVLHTSGPQRFRTTEPGTGCGLGLAIAVGQAKLLGAQLAFRNHPQGGAEALFSFPNP